VVLAGAADARTQAPSQEYLPVSVLPGRLDEVQLPIHDLVGSKRKHESELHGTWR
jgi:hypothetical protein